MSSQTTTTHNWATVAGLINLSRKEKLIGYRWADAFCSVINPYLSVSKRVTLENTGEEAEAAIRTLPPDMQIKILAVLVDIVTFEIAYGEDITTTPSAPPCGDSNSFGQYERYQPPMRPEERSIGHDDDSENSTSPNSGIMRLIALVLVGIAITLTVTLSQIQKESGTAVRSSSLEVVLKVLGDIFTASANTNPESKPHSRRSNTDDSSENYDQEEEPADGNVPRPSYGP